MNENAMPLKKTWLQRVLHIFKKPEARDPNQLVTLLRNAQQANLLDPDSLRMIEGVLQVAEMSVSEIMISRAEMIVIQKDAALQDILPLVSKSGHSRFPVIGENKDDIIGILLAKDLLSYSDDKSEEKNDRFFIKDIIRPAVFVPESKKLNILLHEFRKNRQHVAIVIDEYGGVSGLITIEDVLEQIVGDIEDEHDIDKDIYIRKHKKDYYSIKALTPIAEFNKFFHTHLKEDEFDTIGGLVAKSFGHLPVRGETINVEGIPFTVLRANNRRIQLLKTTYCPPETTSN